MIMQLPYSETLNIEYLGRLLDKTTECYKFFWFKAIIGLGVITIKIINSDENDKFFSHF